MSIGSAQPPKAFNEGGGIEKERNYHCESSRFTEFLMRLFIEKRFNHSAPRIQVDGWQNSFFYNGSLQNNLGPFGGAFGFKWNRYPRATWALTLSISQRITAFPFLKAGNASLYRTILISTKRQLVSLIFFF